MILCFHSSTAAWMSVQIMVLCDVKKKFSTFLHSHPEDGKYVF